MPLIRKDSLAFPDWCEMRHYDIISLQCGETYRFERRDIKEKLIVGQGSCSIVVGQRLVEAAEGSNLDLQTATDYFEVTDVKEPAVLIRMCGSWGSETGGSGLFGLAESQDIANRGDRVDYPKATKFDSHYHDCDEYWILFEGSGTVVSERKTYEVGPGDCIATGKGHHHDFPQVRVPVKAVYFETTLLGQKRLGHLWNYEHGEAEPDWSKV